VKDGFEYRQCHRCGLIWVTPQLTDHSVARIYERGFESKLDTRSPNPQTDVFKPYLQEFEPYRRTNRLLDVGCFTGEFLLAARNRGWEVEGVEISEAAAKYAWDHHNLLVHVHNINDGLGPLRKQGYDVVTLFDVIEHVEDPPAFLRQIIGLLRPGGLLFADTPNFDSAVRLLLGKEWSVFFPWHRYYFTHRTSRTMLAGVGFSDIKIFSEGLHPFSKSNPYKRLLGEGAISAPSRKQRPIRKLFAKNRSLVSFAKTLLKLPFNFLSAFGFHWGTKLIIYAAKPDEHTVREHSNVGSILPLQ